MDIRIAVSGISEILDIRAPSVELLNPHRFSTPTQMGGADPESWSIAIRDTLSNPDKLFTAAHELRHLWQSIHMPEAFKSYTTLSNLDTLSYNLQPAELDANAFAYVIMRRLTNLTPLFSGLPDTVKDRIYARSQIIETDLKGVFKS